MTASKTDVWAYECPSCYATYEPDERPEDGRCNQCRDEPNLREKQSEFGAGLVVCLAKFSEHLSTDRDGRIYTYARWLKMGERERQSEREEAAKYPSGDAARRLQRIAAFRFDEEGFYRYPALSAGCSSPEEYAISQAIHMWANAAGDHFFDLDRERAPEPLIELADLMIRLRNRHLTDAQEEPFTLEHLDRVRELWKQSCIALDRILGTVPNWGEW